MPGEFLAVVERHRPPQVWGQVAQAAASRPHRGERLEARRLANPQVLAFAFDHRHQTATTPGAHHRDSLPIAITTFRVDRLRPALNADAVWDFPASFWPAAAATATQVNPQFGRLLGQPVVDRLMRHASGGTSWEFLRRTPGNLARRPFLLQTTGDVLFQHRIVHLRFAPTSESAIFRLPLSLLGTVAAAARIAAQFPVDRAAIATQDRGDLSLRTLRLVQPV